MVSALVPGVYVVEHKTTSLEIGPGSSYFKRLLLDDQVSTYDEGVRSLGYEPRGVIYDVIRKPAFRPLQATPVEDREYTIEKSKLCPECKKKNPEPGPHEIDIGEGVLVACKEGRVVTDPGGRLHKNQRDRDETPEEYGARIRASILENPEKYFQRGTIVRLDNERADAAKDAWEIGRQIRESQLNGRWPRNTDACDSYGSFCQYFPVCTNEASITDTLRYRDADTHEELAAPEDGDRGDGKKRLPLLTASSSKAYRSCPRKYYYGYELRRRSIETSNALRFGTLMHKALEVWWQTVDLDQAIAAMAGESDPFEFVKARELMRGYHAMWLNEPLDVIAVEQEFRAPMVNPATGARSQTWDRGGKIDAIVVVPEAQRRDESENKNAA